MSLLAGLVIRGDGSNRGGNADQTGTTIIFDLTPPIDPPYDSPVGIGIKGCSALRLENLTIQGAPDKLAENLSIGVYIETVDGASTTAITFHNVSFRYCKAAVQTANTSNNSELAFYDCLFNENLIGFQSLNDQALVQKFIGCVGGGNAGLNTDQFQGMECVFDLTKGGNITVIGFGGQNIETLVKVGSGGGNIGWNLFHNVRLEQFGNGDEGDANWGNRIRTKIYQAVAAGGPTHGQRTEFDGVVLTPPGEGDPADDGTTRFSLMEGHTVIVRNASNAATYKLATVDSKLVDFPDVSPHARGGTIRCFNVTVALDARLDREDVPANARYSFTECNDDNVPYPDLLHPPLYGPNYLMLIESHCWDDGDALEGVMFQAAGSGSLAPVAPSDAYRAGVLSCNTAAVDDAAALASATNALRMRGGLWRCQLSVRIPIASDVDDTFIVRLGFGDDATDVPDNGVFFSYTHGANSGNWQCVVRESGSPTVANTSKGPDDLGWHTFEIEVTTDGVCRFYIDAEEVGVLGTVMDPVAPTDPMGLLPLQIVRSTSDGGEDRDAQIDYYKYTFRPDTRGAMYPQ